jgi:outer membrane protein assembly factor BamB
MKSLPLFAVLVSSQALSLAADWPHWRGVNRDGISTEKQWTSDWGSDGPKQIWTAEVGIGFSAFAIKDGKLYTMGWADGRDTVYCLDADSGKLVWSHSYEAQLGDKYFEGGPLSTPTVDGSVVYTLGKWGVLNALEGDTGKVIWSKNLATETEAAPPEWGFSGSPVVYGEKLILNVGSHGTAVEKKTGKVIWKTGKEKAGYSTPLLIQARGQKAFAYSNTQAFYAVNPESGEVLWKVDWPTRYGVNACDVVPVAKEQFLISSGYGKGSALIDTSSTGDPKIIWESRDLRTQMNPPVLIDGYFYGIDGDESKNPTLNCVEAATGKKQWATKWPESGALMAADGKLIAITSKGELQIIKAQADKYEAVATAQVSSGRNWTVPTLVNGLLYIRNAKGTLLCFDLRKS